MREPKRWVVDTNVRVSRLLADVSHRVEITQRVQACRDVKDDKFLAGEP